MIGPFSIEFYTCSGFALGKTSGKKWTLIGSWGTSSPSQSCDMWVICKWKPMSWGQRSKITAKARRFDPIKSDYVIDPIAYKTIIVESGLISGTWHTKSESGDFDASKIVDIDADVFDAIAAAYERFMAHDEDPDPGKH